MSTRFEAMVKLLRRHRELVFFTFSLKFYTFIVSIEQQLTDTPLIDFAGSLYPLGKKKSQNYHDIKRNKRFFIRAS